MATKIETIYDKIQREIQDIKEVEGYENNSVSFGHFIVRSLFSIDDQTAREAITDGGKDNGIDAIFIEDKYEKIVNFFQFKFPESIRTIKSGFTDSEINGLGTGVQAFLTSMSLSSRTWNKFLIDKHLEVRSLDGYSVKMWVIRYTNAPVTHQLEKLNSLAENIGRLTLNKCGTDIYGAAEICELYESKYEKNYPTIHIKLEVGNEHQSYETERFKSITTVCYLKNLYNAVSVARDNIFDGNVRFYNPKTDLTQAIRSTLQNDPENFILYNNGITIITEDVSFNSPNQTFILKSASIINGAQTVGSILEVMDVAEDKSTFDKAPILIRILEIRDTEGLINNIVYSLNTQTKMFSAYGISNDIRLKNLQADINENTDYFLEVKYNEFETLREKAGFNKYKKNKLDTEKLIQCHVGYNDTDNKAYLAKSAKSDLLKDDNFINKILDDISLESFKESYGIYQDINKIISLFRAYRSSKKLDILEALSINESMINQYQFLTTGDILILFATKHCKNADNDLGDGEAIVKAIHIIAMSIRNISGKKTTALSNITKSKSTFERIKKSIYRNQKQGKEVNSSISFFT